MPVNYQYDVFISYCGQNRKMVQEKLIAPLRNENMKVVWDSDFGNGFLINNITDAIEKSKKVLFILTSEFLKIKSGWTELELAISVTQSCDEKIKKIIPIYFVDRNYPCTDIQKKIFKIYTPIYATSKSDDELIKEIVKRVWEEAVPAFEFSTGGCALAIGSHWDDILLGCLGTLIKLKETLGYHIDVVVLCDLYPTKYYGIDQFDLGGTISGFYRLICQECGFRHIKINVPPLTDRTFYQNSPRVEAKVQSLVENYEEGNKSVRPYNLIFCPPIDDKNSDHAVTSEIVFDKFRIRNHTILEYVIKRYTECNFVPNLCISLDDDISGKSNWIEYFREWRATVAHSKLLKLIRIDSNWSKIVERIYAKDSWNDIFTALNEECPWHSQTETPDNWQETMQEIIAEGNVFRISDAKVSCIENICEVTKKIQNSERIFSPEALRARMQINALDYGKRFDVKYAEVFRGRLDL